MAFKQVEENGNTIFQLTTPLAPAAEFIIRFAPGVEIAFGRGVSDSDITYMRSKNGDAETCYTFANAAQNAITVQASKP